MISGGLGGNMGEELNFPKVFVYYEEKYKKVICFLFFVLGLYTALLFQETGLIIKALATVFGSALYLYSRFGILNRGFQKNKPEASIPIFLFVRFYGCSLLGFMAMMILIPVLLFILA